MVVRMVNAAQQKTANRIVVKSFGKDCAELIRKGEAVNLPFTDEFEAKDLAYTYELLKTNVMKWNWVDDDGAPLPLPSVDPDVSKQLSYEEVKCLVLAITGNASGMRKGKGKR